MRDKKTIKESFSGAASTYDANDAVQRETADKLADCVGVFAGSGELEFTAHEMNSPVLREKVEGCRPSEDDPLVLDAGCGTGSLAKLLASRWPKARVVGCDIALPMLGRMREKMPAVPAAGGDCASLPFPDFTFEMVVSNLALQWVDIGAAFAEARRVLKSGGLFIFSTLGPDTLSELRECFAEAAGGKAEFPMEFRGVDDLLYNLELSGLEPLSIEPRHLFKRYAGAVELVRTLKGIGAAPPLQGATGLSGGVTLRKAGRIYAKKYPVPDGGGVIATYETIFVAARKI